MNLNEIATKADIEILRREIEELRVSLEKQPAQKILLRSSDVRRQLNISDSTLQRMRISGVLPAKKINGTWFYKLEDIQKLIK